VRDFPRFRGLLYGLEPSRWPVLGEALLTVDWTTLCWLEGNLTFLSTVRARYFVHLAWSTVKVTSTISISHFLFLLSYTATVRFPIYATSVKAPDF
jgi:hypothetical protein